MWGSDIWVSHTLFMSADVARKERRKCWRSRTSLSVRLHTQARATSLSYPILYTTTIDCSRPNTRTREFTSSRFKYSAIDLVKNKSPSKGTASGHDLTQKCADVRDWIKNFLHDHFKLFRSQIAMIDLRVHSKIKLRALRIFKSACFEFILSTFRLIFMKKSSMMILDDERQARHETK